TGEAQPMLDSEEPSKGDPGMGVDLDVRDAAHALILRTFAPWSINVELYDASMRWVAEMTDTGYSVCFNVTEQELAEITAALGGLPIVTLRDLRARRRK
ncbi:hypothetical protein, partial [Intrasporangium sp. DVR]|uniref:hypothetical protein n=1 Tax=Intrasporangium sp. DVR TaxID=3127867 RepID=UPI0033419456